MVSKRKPLEKELYKPVKEYLEAEFKRNFGDCYIEITAGGNFSPKIESVITHDIIFSFLGKKASPDLVGFTWERESPWLPSIPPTTSRSIKDFIAVEIKRETIILQDVYQAKRYGDLFRAKYALLISPKPIPEEIKRLHLQLPVLNRFMGGWYVYIGQWDDELKHIYSWFPKSPFPLEDMGWKLWMKPPEK